MPRELVDIRIFTLAQVGQRADKMKIFGQKAAAMGAVDHQRRKAATEGRRQAKALGRQGLHGPILTILSAATRRQKALDSWLQYMLNYTR